MVYYSIGRTSGLLIGSFFFVIFIGDLPEVVIPGNCVSLYAATAKHPGLSTVQLIIPHLSQGPVVRTPFSANSGLKLTQVSFSFYLKHTVA